MRTLFIFCMLFSVAVRGQDAIQGQPLPAWKPGYLDLHHINTGRGNAAFFVLPDGTTLLLDAGELDPTAPRTTSARNTAIRPNNSKAPFEWIADYIKQFSPQKEQTVIDYALITHFHDDHFGSWYPAAPIAKNKQFARTGITGVADLIPTHLLLTRDYHYPVDPDSLLKKLPVDNHFRKTWSNYLSFISSAPNGLKSEFLKAGSATQFHLLHNAAAYTNFQIRNLKSNGLIWTGRDSSVIQHFPPVSPGNPASWPDENTLSNAITYFLWWLSLLYRRR